MDKQIGTSIQWNIIQPSKGMGTDVCYITDEPGKDDANWKKPDMKGYILLVPLYAMPRISISIEAESRLVIASGQGEGGMRSDF